MSVEWMKEILKVFNVWGCKVCLRGESDRECIWSIGFECNMKFWGDFVVKWYGNIVV